MKFFRQLSHSIEGFTPMTEYTQLFLDHTKKLTEEFRCQCLDSALKATQANMNTARNNLVKGKVDITLARKYFVDAIKTAEIIEEIVNVEKEGFNLLDESQKKILSDVYAGYADFLRWSTIANQSGIENVKDYYTKALQLNPDNKEAIATRMDMEYTYDMSVAKKNQ